MVEETAIGGEVREFPKTRWTVVISSREGTESRRIALNQLLSTYWKPLYFYVRRKGSNIENAKDIVQGFFAHLLEQDFTSRIDPKKGRFRAYLRTAIDNYLVNLYESQSAKKRGGDAKIVSLDFNFAEHYIDEVPNEPVSAYEREWALEIMESTLQQLRREFQNGARQAKFEAVIKFFQIGDTLSYNKAAMESGMTESQFKVLLHRARMRFRQILREEILHTVSEPNEIESEIADLMRILRS